MRFEKKKKRPLVGEMSERMDAPNLLKSDSYTCFAQSLSFLLFQIWGGSEKSFLSLPT